MLAAGASAVGIGVAALADPMLPVRLADELADACRARGATSVAELVGTAVPSKAGAPSTRGAEHAR
jgi:dihydroorotate dehydrogenase